jgi:hypothetical protein
MIGYNDTMNPRAPQYIRDLHGYIEQFPFGDVTIKVKRIDKKTAEVETYGEETLRYVNNDEAIRDIDKLLHNLLDTSFSGQAHIKLTMKDGNIQIVSVFDSKQTNYS